MNEKAELDALLDAFLVSAGMVKVRVRRQEVLANLDAFPVGSSLDLGRVVRVDDRGRLGLVSRRRRRRTGASAPVYFRGESRSEELTVSSMIRYM